jgi:RNA polymerase primary sigma factor
MPGVRRQPAGWRRSLDDMSGSRLPAGGRLLSAADEVSLARRIQRGDLSAKDQMIEGNLRLVFAIARTYSDGRVPFADLVQEGTVGLIRAVERFDHRRGLKFSTYAVWWIRCAILNALADSDVIRIPAKANRQIASILRAEAEIERARPPRATDAEIAERARLSVTTVRALRRAARVTGSLDQPVGDDKTPLLELVPDEGAADPSELAIARQQRSEIAAMLGLLPDRQREVLIRRYGLNGRRPQSHREIGEWLGVGEVRSGQIEREALHRLRSMATASARAA